MRYLTALIAGGLFGLGLVLSDMVNPQRVLGFFDVLGSWDPTLLFVLIGAMLPMAITWLILRKRAQAVLGNELPAPAQTKIDGRLLSGAVVFGAGWGLVGICPGPALVGTSFGGFPLLLFAGAMIIGMIAHTRFSKRATSSSEEQIFAPGE